VDDTGGR